MYLIGDIHSHATELKQLLAKLGYKKNSKGIYQHPTRKVIFLDDFIDRGGQVSCISCKYVAHSGLVGN